MQKLRPRRHSYLSSIRQHIVEGESDTLPLLATLLDQWQRTRLSIQETQVRSLGQEDFLEKEMATHASVPAWKIPWAEELGRLQSTVSQRVGHDLVIKQPSHLTSTHVSYQDRQGGDTWDLTSPTSIS